jgi:hypothetical protein
MVELRRWSGAELSEYAEGKQAEIYSRDGGGRRSKK